MKSKIKCGILYKCFIPVGVYQNIKATDAPSATQDKPEEKKDSVIDWKAFLAKGKEWWNTVKTTVKETVTDMANAAVETAKNVGNKIIENVEQITADMFINAFKANPLGAINMVIYPKFQCNKNEYPMLHCGECVIDEETGIHYKQLGNKKSKKYIFFFHGMLYNLDSLGMETTNEYFKKNTEYNFINVEYVSLKNNAGVEVTYGLSQINAMSKIIYNFIKNFIKRNGGNPEAIILCGHSHGNTYPTEILNLFVDENLYVDKLAYLGCKGYLDIEDVLFRAIQTVKKGDYSEFVMKLFNRDITEKLDLIATLRTMFGKEIYNTIISENDINAKLSKILNKINVTNHRLTKNEHILKDEDFNDMLKEYGKITKVEGKIPCLLFYADEDDYVGEEYSKPVKELTINEQKEANEIKQKRDEFFTKIDNIINTEINKMDEIKKEATIKAHEKPKDAMVAQQSIEDIMKKINSNNNNNPGKKQVTIPTTQNKYKCSGKNIK